MSIPEHVCPTFSLLVPLLVWTGALACDSVCGHPPQHQLKETSRTFIHFEESTKVRAQGAILAQVPLVCVSPPPPTCHHHLPLFSYSCPPLRCISLHHLTPSLPHHSSLSGARKKVQRALSGKSQRKPLVR